MTFDDIAQKAALRANEAVWASMSEYRDGTLHDEDDITGALLMALKLKLQGDIGGLKWNASILRHRSGSAAEEKKIGADLLIHVEVDTPNMKFSKGALIQSKRLEREEQMTQKPFSDLKNQCKKMLQVTNSSFVFQYMKGQMRCGSALRISGSQNRQLYEDCSWTSYRFFMEFFRCPIGDPSINSYRVKELPVPNIISIVASGDVISYAE